MFEKSENNALDLSRVSFFCLFSFVEKILRAFLNVFFENKQKNAFLKITILLFLLLPFQINATEVSDSIVSSPEKEVQQQDVADTNSKSLWLEMLIWPFANIVQPVLSAAIYPVTTPLKYAFKNRVIEKGIKLVSFGKEKNIFIYPSFNLTPGANTQMGVVYRHRNIFFNLDYLVFNFSLYANSDWRSTIRYTKEKLFNTDFFLGTRIDFESNRDANFIIPETYESYTQTDSSCSFEARLTHVIPKTKDWSASVLFATRFINTDLPDVNDPILISHPSFFIRDRGFYQDFTDYKLQLSLQFDNTDFPFVPSKGSRVIWNLSHFWVSDYSNLALTLPKTKEKNHNYYSFEFVFQHYFLLGTTTQYLLTASEARQMRQRYADFTWEESVRLWNPQKMKDLFLDRKVIAMQFRFRNLFEESKGGAPYNAFPSLNKKYPLRGYVSSLVAPALVGLSFEYRWPVDRYIDGVFFNEYALFSDKFYSWKKESLRNSWGLGIRVRTPNMFFFRGQVGFHGCHGIALIITIAPEFI